MDIKQFRQQYPGYNDISDMDLATKLHAKNYSDVPFEEFASKFGVEFPTVGKVTGGQGMFGGGYTDLGGSSFGTESGLPKARVRDVPGIVGRGLVSAELGVAKGVVGTVDAALNISSEKVRKVGTPWAPSLPTREEQIESTKGIKEAKRKIMSAQEKFAPQYSGALAWTTRTISEAVPYMANAAVAGAAFGPAGAFGVGFMVEGDYAYDDAISSLMKTHKLTRDQVEARPDLLEQAQRERVVVGSLNAIVEALQVGRVLKFAEGGKHSLKSFIKVARKKGMKTAGKELKGWSGEIARLSIEEALEEFGQEGVSLSVPAAFRGEYPTKEDGSPDWLAIGERLGGAALGGAVAGPVLGGAGRLATGQQTDVAREQPPILGKEGVEVTQDIPPGSNVYKGDDGNTYIETPAQMGDKATQVTEERKDEEGNSRLFVKGTDIEVTQDFEHSVSGRLDAPMSETPAEATTEIIERPETPQMLKKPLSELSDNELAKRVQRASPYHKQYVQEIAWREQQKELAAAEPIAETPAAPEQAAETPNEKIGRQYGLDSEEVAERLTAAETRHQELGSIETTKRTVDERREFRFLGEHKNNLDALLDWETAEDKTKVGKQKSKPIKSQYAAGHEIPKALGMSEKERRAFMKKSTGKTSMAKMSPLEAQDYIDDLHKLAKEKKIDTGILPSERRFKKPIIGLTPQLYKTKILGVEFMVSPAAIGKQRFDLEVAKMSKRLDVMKRIIERLGGETIKTKAIAKLKNKPTKSVARFADLLNENEEAPSDLSKDERAVFNYFRNLSRTILARENAVREELGMEPIAYKTGYMRHIVDTMVEDIIDGRHPMPEELKYWAEKNAPKRISNTMEYQRKLGDELAPIFSNDLIKATKAMVYTGLKEIHLDKPLKFFEIQMALHSDLIPDSTRRWTENFINHMVVGKQTNTDKRLNEMIKDSGIGTVVNKVLKPFGRKISNRPFTNMLGKLGRLQIYGVMGLRPKQIIRNKFQLLQNLAFYTTKSNLRAALPVSEQCKKFISESLFFETYRDQGFEDLSERGKGIFGRGWMKGFQWSAVSNAETAMKAAYYDILELIEDPKHKDLGWADPKRTYTEEHEFLYPSEEKKLRAEMDFGPGCSEYHYIPMAMPGVFKYKSATPVTRLQSWWMNHFFKFHREAAHRFFTGETREGLKLPWSRRVGWGRYMVIGGLVLNTLGYGSSYLFGAAPDALPPLAQLLIGLYQYIVTDDDRTRNQAKWKMLSSIKTFIPGYLAKKDIEAYWENKGDLTKLLFYNKGIFKDEQATTSQAPTRRRVTPPVRRRPG